MRKIKNHWSDNKFCITTICLSTQQFIKAITGQKTNSTAGTFIIIYRFGQVWHFHVFMFLKLRMPLKGSNFETLKNIESNVTLILKELLENNLQQSLKAWQRH
jgi:hypothetical protein